MCAKCGGFEEKTLKGSSLFSLDDTSWWDKDVLRLMREFMVNRNEERHNHFFLTMFYVLEN